MTIDDEPEAAEAGPHGRPSKSARKREAEYLQNLGVELAGLPDCDLDALELPEKLTGAIKDLRRLPSHGARVRQRQFIGKLMRGIEQGPLIERLADRKRRHDAEIRHFQLVERWRDRLLADPAAALDEFGKEYPEADLRALSRLLDKAVKERQDSRPPAAAREVFAFLRGLLVPALVD